MSVSTRPAWLDEGLVFKSVQEPLIFRVRKGGAAVDAEQAYERERDDAAVDAMAAAGVTLAIANGHKAFGLEAEEADIASAERFFARCRARGLRTGVYIGDTMAFETFFLEEPQAREWATIQHDGRPLYYARGAQPFRLVPCRSHPGWIDFQKRVITMCIERLGVDFIHFDNVFLYEEPRSCHCDVCRAGFRAFLAAKYTPAERRRRLGFEAVEGVEPPAWVPRDDFVPHRHTRRITDPLRQEWIDYRCHALAEMYRQLCEHARRLKPDIVLECNPTKAVTNGAFYKGVDLPRLAGHGHFFWVEDGNAARLEAGGRLVSNIRTYKIGRRLNNGVFAYLQRDPEERLTALRVAEAMAFNLDCVGPCSAPPDSLPGRYVWFYRRRRELFAHVRTRADVGVLRSFPSLAWDCWDTHLSVLAAEQTLIQNRVLWHPLFDADLTAEMLGRYGAVVLADVQFVSDAQAAVLADYARAGGGLLLIGETGLWDEMGRRRKRSVFADMLDASLAVGARLRVGDASGGDSAPPGRVAWLQRRTLTDVPPQYQGDHQVGGQYMLLPPNAAEIAAAVHWCVGRELSLRVEAPPTTVAEVAVGSDASGSQGEPAEPDLLLVHLVNFDLARPLGPTEVSVALPPGRTATAARFLDPADGTDQPLPFDAPAGPPAGPSPRPPAGRVRFTLPRVDIYALARVELA